MARVAFCAGGCLIIPAVNVSNVFNAHRFKALNSIERAMKRQLAATITESEARKGRHEHYDILPHAGQCQKCEDVRKYTEAFHTAAFHVIFGVEYARFRTFTESAECEDQTVKDTLYKGLKERFEGDGLPVPEKATLSQRRVNRDMAICQARAQLCQMARNMRALGFNIHLPFDKTFEEQGRRGQLPNLKWPRPKSQPVMHVYQDILSAEQQNAEKYL